VNSARYYHKWTHSLKYFGPCIIAITEE